MRPAWIHPGEIFGENLACKITQAILLKQLFASVKISSGSCRDHINPWCLFSRNTGLDFLVMIDWILFVLLTFYGELAIGFCLLKNLLIKTFSMKYFPVIIQV